MTSVEGRAYVAGRWMLASLVPASALAVGSLHPTVLVIMSLVAAVSAVLLWLESPRRVSRASRWVLIGFSVLLGATVLQSIPLPSGLVAAIAPSNADVWARAFVAFREPGPSMHPLSVAPTATRLEILRGVFYGCTFLAALRIALKEGGSRFLESVVVASATVVSITTLAHTAVHAEKVFGFYAPRDAQGYLPGRIGPLLNPNHLAAYCNVGALVAIGTALQTRVATHRLVAGAAAILLAGTSVWAGSRGGTASLVLGFFLVTALSWRARRKAWRLARPELTLALAAFLIAGAVLGFAASDIARADLAGRDLTKLEIAKTAFRLVARSPVFGSGRGSFESIFPSVHEAPSYVTFIRPENIIAQWLVEWGTPVAIIGFASLAIALRPTSVVATDARTIAAWVAVVVVVVHDLVDFHLEVPGVVVVTAVCVACIVGRRALDADRRLASVNPASFRRLVFALAGGAVLAMINVVPDLGHSLAEDRDRIAKAAVDRAASREIFRDQLRATLERHPAEPFFPLAAAIRAQAIGDDAVIPWIARALERYPTFGRAHLVLARTLVPRNRAQARLEYRLAYEQDANIRHLVLREAPLVVDDRDSALDLVSNGSGGEEVLEALSAALVARLPATSVQLDEELLRRSAPGTGPLKRATLAAISDVENEHPWCADRETCTEKALDAAREWVRREPTLCEPRVATARVELAAGRTSSALDALARSLDGLAERNECLRSLVSLCLERGEKRRADDALDLAMRSGCGTREECLGLYAWAAGVEEGRGNSMRAIGFYRRVTELGGDNDAALIRIGELAEQAGLTAEAVDAYGKLSHRHPEDARWRAKQDAIRAKALDRRFEPR